MDEQDETLDQSQGETPSAILRRRLPGAMLRAAREKRGMSQEDVAQTLRFSVYQIDALEKDDYDRLPGTTVVRGFLRSYAKLLKLEPTGLLAALDQEVPHQDADVRPPTNIGEAEEATLAERLNVRHLVAVGVILLLILLGFLYTSVLQEVDGEKSGADSKSVESSDSAPIHAPVTVSATVASPLEQPLPLSPVAVDAPSPAPAASGSVAATGAIPVVAVPGTSVTNVSPAGSSTVTPSLSAVSAVAPVVRNDLRVEFDGRSWIEVRDATQAIVLSGEYHAGTRHLIAGKPPYKMLIGKAQNVRVYLGERNLDLRPNTVADVARLTVE